MTVTQPEFVFVVLGIQNAMRMPYCSLWPASLCSIFPCYLINGTIFEKELLNVKCVFRVSLQTLPETFFVLRRME